MAGKIQEAAVAVKEQNEGKALKGLIKAMSPEVKKALPSMISEERFVRMITTAISSNPDLAKCTQTSFMGAMMSAAQLGLEPNTPLGQAYLIPYQNKGKKEVQFQIGYRGYIELAHRSGQFKAIEARTVYENDEFDYCYGLESDIKHRPAMADRGNPIAYYAVYKLVNGGYGFEVMSISDVKDHAKQYSKSYGSNFSPWKTNFDAMAKKTVLKKVLKYAPLNSELQKIMETDSSIKSKISENMTDIENEIEYEYEEAEVVEDYNTDQPEAETPKTAETAEQIGMNQAR